MTFGPAEKMRIARGLAARALGVDELPPDAEVECALGEDGVLHVRGTVVARGVVPTFTCEVSLANDPPKK